MNTLLVNGRLLLLALICELELSLFEECLATYFSNVSVDNLRESLPVATFTAVLFDSPSTVDGLVLLTAFVVVLVAGTVALGTLLNAVLLLLSDLLDALLSIAVIESVELLLSWLEFVVKLSTCLLSLSVIALA